MSKKTLVLGASTKINRYSNRAVKKLKLHGFDVVPVGRREGEIDGIDIQQGTPLIDDIHTITLYLNPQNQRSYYDYILNLHPQRIIFNPGTENIELARLARANGIETENACTLVMLSIGNY